MTRRPDAEEPPGTPNPWPEVMGPCYTEESIGRVLGWSSDQVADATAALDLLAFTTSDGVVLYPAWQIHHGAVIPGLGAVLRTLRTGFDNPGMWAGWLRSSLHDDGRSVARTRLDALSDGDRTAVFRDAEHTAASWRA